MDTDTLKEVTKTQIPTVAKALTATDIGFLVETLKEKDDKLRYTAFLLLQAHSRLFPSVYPYWEELAGKLDSDNSYQRSLGLMLLSENVRWDKEGKFGGVIGKYLGCCQDEKFITSRQAIQGLQIVIAATNQYNAQIEVGLSRLDLSVYKENQQKLLKKDAANVLKVIQKSDHTT
jgi:hypothetical protein